jgi:hypothetical protein
MKNLCDIKEGDKVVYSKLFQPDKVLKVTKVTKTLIICGTTRFNKQTGFVTGENAWNKAQIHYPEDGEIEAINKQSLIHSVAHKLHILDPVDITYEQAVKVREIFNW